MHDVLTLNGAQPGTVDNHLILELEALKQDKQELENKRYLDASTARFASLMRWKAEHTLETWADEILSELVSYVGGLQASLYMLAEGGKHLQWVGGYACPAETPKLVQMGEGLTGQAAKSGFAYYYDDPDTFKAFTYSSLSTIPARVLLVQPLIYNEAVEGVLEISAVEAFSELHLELIKSLGESMAANLNTVRSQVQLQKLFHEAQEKSEMLLSQEEELRQNLEELEATQDEMKRAQLLVEESETKLKGVLNSTTDMIMALDPQMRIMTINKAMHASFVGGGFQPEVGQPLLNFVTPDQHAVLEAQWHRALSGEKFMVEFSFRFDEKSAPMHFHSNYHPMYDSRGQLFGAVVYAREVTEFVQQKMQLADQAAELEAQQEELRQNLEELEATQEEMQRAQLLVQESEAKLRSVLNSTTDRIMAVDGAYNILLQNKAMTDAFVLEGLNISVGQNVMDYLPESDQDRFKGFVNRAMAGEKFDVHYSIQLTPQSPVQHNHAIYHPLEDADGKVYGIVTYVRDITQQVEQQQAVEEANSRFDLINQATSEGLWELTIADGDPLSEQTSIWYSATFRQMLGYSTEAEFPNLIATWFDIIHPDDQPDVMLAFLAHMNDTTGKTPFDITYRVLHKDGKYRWFTDIGATQRLEDGKPLRTAGSMRDVTQELEAKAELQNLNEELLAQQEELRQNLEELATTQEQILQAREELVRQKQLQDAILNNATDLIGVLDTQYNLVTYNDAYAAVFRAVGIEMAPGMHLREFINPAEYNSIEDLWARALAGDEFTQEVEYSFNEQAGKVFFETQYKPLNNAQGERIGAVLYSRNITLQKQQQANYEEIIALLKQQLDTDITVGDAAAATKPIRRKRVA